MMIPLFDFHCDTLYETGKQGKSLFSNDLHLSLERLLLYKPFCQVLAMWSDSKLSGGEAWKAFLSAHSRLILELREHQSVRLVTNSPELTECESGGFGAVMLAVEGGKLIENDVSRLDVLRSMGVRFMTLTWDDECPVCGSNKMGGGVTEFGYSVLSRMGEIGIIPDVSHASDSTVDEVVDFCRQRGGVCIATHSNSRSVCDHRRNLTDGRFEAISKLGGIVGISLCPQHLANGGDATVDDAVRHIEHYMSLGGENSLCLGCDFDGVDSLPKGIKNVSDLEKIAEALGRINYTDNLIKKIFYANARNFISLWIK